MTAPVSSFFIYSELHFKNCPVEFREILSNSSSLQKINDAIQETAGCECEFVNLSTCNRFTICIFGSLNFNQILDIFSNLANSPHLSREKLARFLRIEFDAQALKLLFRVAASLDSMVLGESQILGQIKQAFLECTGEGFARNSAYQVFSHSFRIAKKIRLETGIGSNAISIGHAAIQIVSRVFHTIQDKTVVVFGAGEMARVTAQYLMSSGIKHLFIANRTFSHAQRLTDELAHSNCKPLELQHALSQIHAFDVCIFAVAGHELILSQKHMSDYEKKRQGNSSVLVDISVPRKVDPALSQIENLFLFNVDDLNPVVEHNRVLRKMAAAQAEKIIEAEVSAYLALCEQKENLANIGKFHSWLTNVINIEMERYLKQNCVEKKGNHKIVADAVAKKIVSHAALLAKINAKPENPDRSVGELIEFLFNLSNQPLLPENQKNTSNVISIHRRTQ